MSVEWTWTSLSVLALLTALWGLLDAWADLRAVDGEANGRRRIARGYMRAEAIRMLVSGGWLYIGLKVVGRPEPASWSEIVVVLVLTNAAILTSSLLDARDRLAVRRMGLYGETTTQREDREAGIDRRATQSEALQRQDEQDQAIGVERRRLQALDKEDDRE